MESLQGFFFRSSQMPHWEKRTKGWTAGSESRESLEKKPDISQFAPAKNGRFCAVPFFRGCSFFFTSASGMVGV